jgi:hypothetical protein
MTRFATFVSVAVVVLVSAGAAQGPAGQGRGTQPAGRGGGPPVPSGPSPTHADIDCSTSAAGCAVNNPAPFVPTWQTVIEFFDKHLRAAPATAK